MKFEMTNLYCSMKVCLIAWMMVLLNIRIRDAILHMMMIKCKVIEPHSSLMIMLWSINMPSLPFSIQLYPCFDQGHV